VLTARLDPDELTRTRKAHTMLADRLPDQGETRRSLTG
jgi:hypothetical protein